MVRKWSAVVLFFSTVFVSGQVLSDTNADKRIPYALTISGGVSLGAYESGVNWALLRYLKKEKEFFDQGKSDVFPDLVAVTGASAGSINSLISAISWCADDKRLKASDEYQNTATDNLFYKTWNTVGLDNLMPKPNEDNDDPYQENYKKGDGLLSRVPFNKVIDEIKTVMKKQVFHPKCEIPFGLTVTAEQPADVTIAGLTVQNQRKFIPILLKVDDDGNAAFYSKLVDRFNPNFGDTIYLSADEQFSGDQIEYKLNAEQVIQAVLASSSFPVAFGRKPLEYCSYEPKLARAQASKKQLRRCFLSHEKKQGVFMDGGVFDNIPLGATMGLAETRYDRVARRVNYLYIDPDRRRVHGEQAEVTRADAQQELTYDIGSQLNFLSGSVTTARKYELYKVLRSQAWAGQLSSRLAYLEKMKERLGLNGGGIEQDFKALRRSVQGYELDLQYSLMTVAQVESRRTDIIRTMRKLAKTMESDTSDVVGFDLQQFRRSLQQVEFDVFADRRLFLSSRYPAISGEFLGAFAAFFSKDFRDYDYYTGIYDAVIQASLAVCEQRMLNSGKPCEVKNQISRIYNMLVQTNSEDNEVSGNEDMSAVFIHLLSNEFPGEDWPPLLDGAITRHAQFKNHQLHAVSCSLTGGNHGCQTVTPVPEDFKEFVANLATHGYDYKKDKQQFYLSYAIENGDNWWRLPAYRASARLNYLENQAPETTAFDRPFNVLTEVTKALYYAEPTPWWKPYELGIGLGSESLTWKQAYIAWNFHPRISDVQIPFFSLHVVPFQRVTHDEDTAVGKVGVIIWPKEQYRFGIGPDLSFRWTSEGSEVYSRVALGASMYIKIQRVQVTLGMRSLKSDDLVKPEDNNYLNVSYLF